jgi:hypothetical protein
VTTRRIAMEFLVALAEFGKGMIRKVTSLLHSCHFVVTSL